MEGKLIRDTEAFGKMDPYCLITLVGDNKPHKTKVHRSGGKTPKWGEEFEIVVTDFKKELRFAILDEDVTTSDKVGFGLIKYASLCFNRGVSEWFCIFYENKMSG